MDPAAGAADDGHVAASGGPGGRARLRPHPRVAGVRGRRFTRIGRHPRLRPVTGEAGVVGKRVLESSAGRIVRMGGSDRRAGQKDTCEGRAFRQPPASERSYPRRTAPVFFPTSATMRPMAASISASVSVRSVGCKVTVIATDFAPSGRPAP